MAFKPKTEDKMGFILNPDMKLNDLTRMSAKKANFDTLQEWRGEHGEVNQRQAGVERHKDVMFDPYQRSIGVDLKGLAEQVREKRERRLRDAAEEARVAAEINQAASIAQCLEERRRRDVKMREQALTKWWIPKKPDVPKMYCDPEALSLKFHGEDLKKKERDAFQKEQNREWYLQQIEEKRCIQEQKLKEKDRYDQARLTMDCVALQMEAELRASRKTMAQCYAGANALMMGQKTDECDDDCDKRREIANLTLASGVLPNPDCTGDDLVQNADLITRTRLTPQDRAKQKQLEADLKAQMFEDAMRKQKEKEDLAEKDAWLLDADRKAVLYARKLDVIGKELRKQRQSENVKIAQEQRHKADHEKCLYTNEPTAEFFDQFNKCRVR